jgi:hypothetical protein
VQSSSSCALVVGSYHSYLQSSIHGTEKYGRSEAWHLGFWGNEPIANPAFYVLDSGRKSEGKRSRETANDRLWMCDFGGRCPRAGSDVGPHRRGTGGCWHRRHQVRLRSRRHLLTADAYGPDTNGVLLGKVRISLHLQTLMLCVCLIQLGVAKL